MVAKLNDAINKQLKTPNMQAALVNRVGDFGMIIGLMAIWTTLGTFNFGDMTDADGKVAPGIFSQLRDKPNHFQARADRRHGRLRSPRRSDRGRDRQPDRSRRRDRQRGPQVAAR